MIILDPVTIRDFRRGRISNDQLATFLSPENSVANSLNVNFDQKIGVGTVRRGTSVLTTILSPASLTSNGSFSGTDDSDADFYGANWQAQTFVPTSSGYIYGVSLKLKKTGSPTGMVKVSIYNTTAGVPSGAIRTSGYILGSSVSAGTNTITIPLSPYFLSTSSTYAIVISLTGGDASNKFSWRYVSGGGYADGQRAESTDSGSTWSASAGTDAIFEIFKLATSDTSQVPLGLTTFKTTSLNNVISVFYSSIFSRPLVYSTNTFNNTLLTDFPSAGFSSAYKFRFAQLGGRMFVVNGVTMGSTDDGYNWDAGTSGSVIGNIEYIEDLDPTLIIRAKNRLLASGVNSYPSRIYFSSVIDPSATPFITWNTDASTGDWIDINPDDGGTITGFSETSTLVLVFKDNAMYRLNVIAKTVDTDNVFNIGAVSQEAIVKCNGLVYFFSGPDIRRTDGGFPEQISRLGVQDFIDAIPVANWSDVILGADDFNVFASIGDVTLNIYTGKERTYTNVVLKFSTRDESWSVHSYGQKHKRYGKWTNSSVYPYSSMMIELDSSGTMQVVDSYISITDNTVAVNYEVEMQEIEFGNRSHTKQISDKVVAFTENGQDSYLQVAADGGDYKDIIKPLNDEVNVAKDINIQGNVIQFKWLGTQSDTIDSTLKTTTTPTLVGLHLPKVSDLGIIK